MKPFRPYINPFVKHQLAQPPHIAPDGADGCQLRTEDAPRILPFTALLDSYESWRSRMQWLAAMRRNQR
jgi:hypothetical protein